jgi:hypothetical protein
LTHCHTFHVANGIGTWRIEPASCEGLSKSFFTAILLTANMECAERAVLRSIRLLERERVSESSLLRGTIQTALAARVGITEQLDEVCSMLPLELQKVLHLPRGFRQCFVLRILLGLSREVCASLLGLDVQQIDEQACASIRRLAVPQDRRPAN